MSYRGRGEVVPIEVARQIHAEREQALAHLERAQQDSVALRRALEQREEEQRRLLQTARALEAELAAARRAPAPPRHLPNLEVSEAKARQDRDAAVGECARLRTELEDARSRLGELEAAHDAANAQVGEMQRSEPDNARVNELLGDLANLRRRRDIDLAAGVRAEQIRLLGRLADVRDSVHWALAARPDPNSPWYAGLIGIRDQIDRQLAAEGATVFGAEGEVFDPRLHEGVSMVTSGAPGRIVKVESPGIRLEDGTVVRPARVQVST